MTVVRPNRILLLFLLLVTLFIGGAGSAFAQLTLTLIPSSVNGTPGKTVGFRATVKNTGAAPVYLNQLSVTVTETEKISINPADFYDNFEGQLAPGAEVTAKSIFTARLAPNATVGTYSGAVAIQGGGNSDAVNNLAQTGFSVVVGANSAAPETTILTGPVADVPTYVTEATFTYIGVDPETATGDLRYRWRLDNGAWTETTETQVVLKKLTYATHTFEVAAVDEADAADPTPASREFVVQKPKLLVAAPDVFDVSLDPTTPITKTLNLTNLSDKTLTGISATIVNTPPNVELKFVGVPATLAPQATVPITVTVLAKDDTVLSGVATMRVSSTEGESGDSTFNVTVVPRRPVLVAVPGSLNASMLRGSQSFAEVEIENRGSVDATEVKALLPTAPWLSLVTPQDIGTIKAGEKAKVGFSLLPSTTLPLGPYTGSIAVNAQVGGIGIPFLFNAISDNKSSLRLVCEDEFTYFAQSRPRLGGATVILRDRVTGNIVAQGTTPINTDPGTGTEAGVLVLTNVLEGFYDIEVSADKHGAFKSVVEVVGGQTKEYKPFLPRQLVTYTWNVVPVDTEDKYEVTLDATFETNVPAPVVTVNPTVLDVTKLAYDQDNKAVVYYTITNHGLIAANGTTFTFDNSDLYRCTPLISDIGKLEANQTLIIPVTVEKLPTGNRAFLVADCGFVARVRYNVICDGPKWTEIFVNILDRKCLPSGPVYISGGGGDTGGNSGNGGVSFHPPTEIKKTDFCSPCAKEIAKQALLCILGCNPIPVFGQITSCLASGYGCVDSLTDSRDSLIADAWNCATVPFCWTPVSCIFSLVSCADSILYTCEGKGIFPSGNPPTRSGIEYLRLLGNRGLEIVDAYSEYLGSSIWFTGGSGEVDHLSIWLSKFEQVVKKSSPEGEKVSNDEENLLLSTVRPLQVLNTDIKRTIIRWNRTVDYNKAGIFTKKDLPLGASSDFIALDILKDKWRLAYEAITAIERDGYTDFVSAMQSTLKQLLAEKIVAEEGVCARVKIRLTQEVTLTRTAFKATLEVSNNQPALPLDKFKVTLVTTDDQDADAGDRFGVPAPVLTNIAAIDGTQPLAGGTTATVQWTLTPNRDAAPTGDRRYFVGGTIEYEQDGQKVTIPIFPAPITVKPDPLLTMHYFWQREVYSDDPFTELTEPAEPFALGLLVLNKGYGTARNMTIVSSQPEIVENDKGLLVDFKIVNSHVDDGRLTPSLTLNLGNIEPISTRTATWFMTSTLQGKFIDYSAKFRHISELGDPRLSLIDTVNIHELEHIVRVTRDDDKKPDFLANDRSDDENTNTGKLPDTLYSSDGTVAPVQAQLGAVPTGPVSLPTLTTTLNVPNTPAGWTFLRLDDPAQGRFKLLKVIRADGKEVRLWDNAWITRRTIRLRGQAPYRENRLHLFDKDVTATYTIVYGLPDPRGGSAGGLKPLGDDVPVAIGFNPPAGNGGNGDGGSGGGGDPGDGGVGGGNDPGNPPGGDYGVLVTAVFPDALYLESPDRSNGIKVIPAGGTGGFAEGDQVRGSGLMKTDANSERYIAASELAVVGRGRVDALGLNTRAFFGGDFFTADGGGQKGVREGVGLNPTGLLARTRGAVTVVESDSFGISDGFGRSVRVLMPQGVPSTVPPVGAWVDVTGIVSIEKVGGDLLPLLRLRRANDLGILLNASRLTLPAPEGTLRFGSNLFTLPGMALPPDPLSVFRFLGANGIVDLQGRLSRYDAPTQSEVFYDNQDPTRFGGVLTGDGLGLRLNADETGRASFFTLNGYGMDFADAFLSVPKLGAARLGTPFLFETPWENVRISDGFEAIPLRDAAKTRVPFWFNSIAEFFDNGTQQPKYLGLPEDNRDTTVLAPWRGYFMTSGKNNLALFIPTVSQSPTLAQAYPASATPAVGDLTITLTGTGFLTDTVAFWDSSPRTTIYVSPSQLKVLIPAPDLNLGAHYLTVESPGKKGAPDALPVKSNAVRFMVSGLPRLSVEQPPVVTRSATEYTVTFVLTNMGSSAANRILLTSAVLGTTSSTTQPLPSGGALPPGQSVTLTLTFPLSAGGSGASVFLKVQGSYTGGTFTTSRRVSLP